MGAFVGGVVALLFFVVIFLLIINFGSINNYMKSYFAPEFKIGEKCYWVNGNGRAVEVVIRGKRDSTSYLVERADGYARAF